jgi:tetrahydromethanopterin S-methyltransferase subunit A
MKKVDVENWPVETGRYIIGDKKSCIAVCTLSSLDIELPIDSIAIVGKCVTENVGMEKIIKNIISNPNIRFLLLCGVEPKGHYVGQAFKCLIENGLDAEKKIIGARGAMPIIKNVTDEQIKRFKHQVEIVDLIEEENPQIIIDRINKLYDPGAYDGFAAIEKTKTIIADYDSSKEDTADNGLDDGFFTIFADKANKQIVVEHYKSDKKFDCRIVGKTAEAIIGTIVKMGLIKGLYHAGYLGKELKKAEIALKTGRDYEQDKELRF